MSAKEGLEVLPPEGWGYKCAPPHLVYEVLGLAPTKAFYKLSHIFCVCEGVCLYVCIYMLLYPHKHAHIEAQRSVSGIFFFPLYFLFFKFHFKFSQLNNCERVCVLDVCIEVRGQFAIDGGYFFPPYRPFGLNSGHQVGSRHLHLLSKPLILFSETRSLNEPSQLDWLAMESPGFPISSVPALGL